MIDDDDDDNDNDNRNIPITFTALANLFDLSDKQSTFALISDAT